METLLAGLRAAGEPTRLRILALLSQGELTVRELTELLGQSQPRVSQQLKHLCEARLLERVREGSWVFHRIADSGPCAHLLPTLLDLVPRDDPVIARDAERLEALRRRRQEKALSYFRRIAPDWAEIRSLHVPEAEVEAAMLELVGEGPIGTMADLGTGTGRMLQVFAPVVERATGFDFSRDMLNVARANLSGPGYRHCQVRLADIRRLDLDSGSQDLVTIHQVLHYLDEPARVIWEAARVLAPGGRLLVVDFASHDLEYLRAEHAHRRLGFNDREITTWCQMAGLRTGPVVHLSGPGEPGGGTGSLTVSIWNATRWAESLHEPGREMVE